MRRLAALRLPLLILFSAWLGYVVFQTPGLATFELPDGSGSVTVPRSLEEWRLDPGQGDVLLHGSTRFGLIKAELVRTNVPVGGDLKGYIAQRHDQTWRSTDDYVVKLRGEVRQIGQVQAPMSSGIWPSRKFLGMTATYLREDLYLVHKGQYVRLTLEYPEMIENYIRMDRAMIANNLKLAP